MRKLRRMVVQSIHKDGEGPWEERGARVLDVLRHAELMEGRYRILGKGVTSAAWSGFLIKDGVATKVKAGKTGEWLAAWRAQLDR